MGGGKRPANRSGRLSASAGRGGEEKAADGPVDGREFVEDEQREHEGRAEAARGVG